MQAVLMLAGKSTRTYPLTLTRPKPLLPIANRPILFHSLDQLAGLFDEIILIVGYRKEMIEQLLGSEYRGVRLIYQEQREQLGTGHAILQARPHIRDRFVAMNGDDLFAHEDLENLIKHPYAALAMEVPDPSIYGVCQVDERNRLLNMVEKPKEFIGNLANIGCYVFEPEIFDILARVPLSVRGEIEVIDGIMQVRAKRDFIIVPTIGFWLPTGYPWDLLKHQELLMASMREGSILGEVENGVTLKGPVTVGAGSILRSGTYIEGPVIIGENCVIGPNCYIRKYTAVGDGCRIGHGVEVKNSIIMSRSSVAHLSYVGDSVIGYECNLGAGFVAANIRHDGAMVRSTIKGKLVDSGREKLGAILADGVRTGVMTAVNPGRKIWPGTSTRPGTVVDEDIMPEDGRWD